MDKDRFIDDHNYSFSERVRSNRLSSLSCNLIRFSILLIAIFLLFSITANDETQIAYASENLTDLELESANLYAINDSSTNQTTSETSNSSSELIDPSGTVTSWTGYPISDLTVSAWQGSQLISQTVTDGDGAYNLVLPQGNYEITAGGITTGGEEQKEYLPQTQQVDVQEPVTVNFPDMLHKNSVYGMITDENGNPLQYTMAEIYDEEGNCLDDNDASADGHYKLDLSYYFSQQDPSVTSGTFTVLFYDDLLEDQEFTIQVNRDEVYRLDVVMQPATILQGTVTGQSTAVNDGTNEISEVILYFVDHDGNEDSDSCSIDHTKNYYFKVNPSLVTVHHIGMNVYGYYDYYQPISLTPEQVNIHDITLVERGILKVNVTNSTNHPLTGASVSVQSDSFDYHLYTWTEGILYFAVEDDDWTVSASHPDYNKMVKYITVSGGGSHQLDFTLIKEGFPATLEGYVTDSVTGTPISNCYVSMGFSNGEYQYVDTMTDANGHYVFDSSLFEEEFYSGLKVDLNAEKQDYNPYSTSFILPEGLFTYNISLVHDTILWGSVTDPDGNVVYADVTLSYVHNGETVEQSTNVDECGYYRFEGITPADDSQYHLSAQHSFYLPYQTTLNVLPNQSTQHDIIMNYYSGSVTVNILNTQGQGISGVTVSIGNETFAIVKTTDATGSTTFQHIPDGNWAIEANYAGYAPATAPVSIYGGSEQVTLTLIQRGLPVTMEGYVTDAVDGSPLTNAQIYFWPSSHPTQTNIYTKTDSNGYYKLSSAQFSEFVSGLSGVLDVRPFQHEKPKISMTIGEGPQIQYNLQLNPYTGSITVHLIDITHNQPVQGLTVYLWGDEDQETTSDATGTAVFEKVGPSDWWEICTYDPNNEYYYWDGYYYPLTEGEYLEITAFMVPTIIAANIGGTVVDDTNNVVPGARVELSLINGNWIYTWSIKTTDVYGKFLMDLDNTANLMRVTISKAGYQTAIYDFSPTDLPINQTFLLQPDFSLTTLVDGYVQDFFETPLSGVTVDFYRGATLYQTIYTNPAGYYNINLPVGIYNMVVHQTGFVTQNQGFTIFYGSAHQFNYTLPNDSSLFYLYGRVFGNTIYIYDYNIPINGASIKIYQNGNLIDSTTSDQDGYYQTNSVPPGDYTIQVQAHNYDPLIQSVTLTETYANYQDFILEPSTSCGIHGYVTDENTGLPISNVNIGLFNLWEEKHVSDTLTDQTGFYSFTNLVPGYYNLEYSATGYVTSWGVDDGSLQLDVGEDAELDKALEPIIPSTIEGTVNSWSGPVEGATVTLDNTITTLTGSDGKFIFPTVITDWHEIFVNKSGIENSWSGWIENNEYKTISIYLNAKVLETDPVKDSTVQNLDQIKVRAFNSRPDINTASLSVLTANGAVSGSITRENDWIIFTPSGGAFTTQGRYTVTTTIPSELTDTFEFYYYPITNTPPVVQIVSPASGSFFRDPTSISISANIQNDVGNGISTDSKIYFDGVALPTTLSGRQITATANNFGHGWHTIRAVAVDNQGITGETSFTIFISLQAPYFSNIGATELFSAHYDNMHIEADISEPIKSAYVTFEGYPDYQLQLGNFNDKIDSYWDGRVNPNSWSTIIHPDGPVTFTLHGQGLDGVWFTIATGNSQIDSTPPVITFDNNYFNNHELDVTGYISDYCGVYTFDASSSGGSLQKSFSSGNFNLRISVDEDAKYTITVNATDLAGNMGSTSQVIWVDTVNPSIQFITPDSDSEVRPGQIISFRLGDDFTGLQRDYQYPNYPYYPQNFDVLLDGVSIKDLITFSNTNNMWGYYENYNPTQGYEVSLLGIKGTYQPSQQGYLTDGLHELKITLSDLAGNEIDRILSFSSITKDPEAAEKDMGMKANTDDQTLWTSFDVKENSDRGFSSFQLYLDGSEVPESSSFISTGPNQGTVSYTLTRNFTPGPHTIKLVVTDGLGLTTSLDTGFYFDSRIGVPTSEFTTDSDYLPDVAQYTGNYVNSTSLLPNVYFQPYNQAIYGFSQIFAPTTVMYDPKIPMGFQSASTILQLASVNAGDNTHLSLWMTEITDSHNSHWGWGEAISVYFYDGSQTIPTLETRLYNLDDSIIYAHHEPPWGNVAGLIDKYVATATGADGRTWKEYIVPIPDGLDKSHLSVIIAWRTINWNSWGSTITNYISSKVDGLEFFTPLVDQVYPVNEATDVPLSPTVSAHFRIPMDPDMFTSNYFYLKDSKGNTAFTTNSFNSATGWGNMVPNVQLNGKTKYTAYISSDIRTIYGRILPEPSPYTWSFTTREGESAKWQTIWYNGEQYDIYLTFGPGYNGYKPGYLSPSTIASQAGASLLGIYITKNGYEIADMELKKTILLAAERKAYYESLGTMGSLIDQAQVDYADDAANSILADVSYYGWLIWTWGTIPRPPDSDDVIRSSIARALADGFDQTHVPGYITKMLSWFKIGLTGADKINTAIGKLQKMQGETSNVPTQKAIGKTIKIYQLVDGEISFSMELAEYTFQLLWELEVADYYRPQLTYIRDHSSGDTRTSINQLLNWDKENVELRISEKIVDHIRDQTIALVKEEIEDELMATPAAPAIIVKKVFEFIISYLGVFDAHSQAHVAVDLAGADANFYNSRNAAINSLPTYHITPDDLSLVSTASRMWYSTAGDFYDTMSAMVTIVKNWPSLVSGADINSLNQAIASYNTVASNYHSHASNMIPELSGSSSDINALFSLIKAGTTGKPAYIQIGAHSPIALMVTDELGRRIGYDPVTGQNVNDFTPDGGYTGPYTEPQLISIPVMAGQLTIQAFGTGTGTFTIDLETYDENGLLISGSTWTGTAVPGVTQIFTLAVDGLGDVFPVDSHPPEITVNGITEGTSYTAPVTPQIIVIDDNLESWYSTLNGVNYTGEQVSAEGVYNLFIRATDGINVVYKTMQFSIDLTPPQINILGFNDGDYSQMVLPYVKVVDDNLASINLKLDGIDYIEDPVRTEGQHTFTALATDDAGHQSIASGSFIIDNTNPTIDIFGLVNGTVYQGGVTPTININDLNLASTNILLDGNTYTNGNAILNTLSHHLIVDAVDKAGNQATQEIWFTVIPNGGVIITNAGGSAITGQKSLTFPTDAVSEDTAVTINELNGISNIPPNLIYAGHAFNVLAENLQNGSQTNQLNQPVLITLHYLDSDVIGIDENTLQIFYWNTTTLTWEALPSTLDTVNNIITAFTNHFSTFSIMGTLNPPEITINGVIDGTYYPTTVTPQITVTSNYLQSWSTTLNGNNYTSGTTITNEGTYTLHITATDGTNTAEKTLNFSIDLTPPTINILEPQNNGFYQSIQPSINIIDNNLATTIINLDGTPLQPGTIIQEEGQHTITATATDKAGHQTTTSTTFTIDHTNPTINIIGLTDGTVYPGGVTPTININDLNLASTNILLDGNTYTSSTPITNTLHHHLTIDATDKAGNQATQEIGFTVIPTGGSIINDTGGTTTPGQVNLNFPNGALDEDTVITINDVSGTSNPTNFLFAGHAFDITAVNLQDGSETSQLNQPVIITFHYLDSDIAGLEENTLQIFYWNTTTSTWTALPSIVDTENNIVTAYIGHLSIYALMGRPIQEPSNPNTPENQPVETTTTTTQQNSGTTQNSGVISGYSTSNLLISAPLTLQSPSAAATVPAQQQQANTGETTPGINNWIIYALVFLVAVIILVLLSRRIIKS